MTMKIYRAQTMADALTEVKRDLGNDAVILNTRSYKTGGVLGLGARSVVEITASTADINIPVHQPRAASHTSVPPRQAVRTNNHSRRIQAAYSNTPSEQSQPEVHLDDAIDKLFSTSPQQTRNNSALSTRPGAQPSRHVVAPMIRVPAPDEQPLRQRPGSDQHDEVQEDIAGLKELMGQVLQCSRQAMLRTTPAVNASTGTMPDALFNHYLKLLECHVADEIADEIVGCVRDELSPGELDDEAIVRQTVLRHLATMIRVPADVSKPGVMPDGRPLTIALVGPTGVGKTTTVAKLAAAYKLRHNKRVGLIAGDTYRIAAVDQLRTYAEIIGLPLKVATTPDEMALACQSLADRDVILIDTAGRSQNDAKRVDELSRFIRAAAPHETHLVLSGAADRAVMFKAAEKFKSVEPNRVIFTKLDEAVNFGVLITASRRIGMDLSYVTTGQEVPDHIETSRPDRLARLVLDGMVS